MSILDPVAGGRARTVLYTLSALVGTVVVILSSAPQQAWTPVVLGWLVAIASGLAHLTDIGNTDTTPEA